MVTSNPVSTEAVASELDRVLESLTGRVLYRDNAFRVTGLPADASPRQVRRGREERMNPYYEPSAESGAAPLPPSADPDALHHAFEGLRDPLLRLAHELLWLRPDVEADHPHNTAVRTHCAALESEDSGQPDPAMWATALRTWSAVLDSGETWTWAKARVRAIDDPRLTLAAVRALRERLPEHLVGVSLALAATAAADGDTPAAERHLRLLNASPFTEALVRKAARNAVRGAEARVKTACETAEDQADSGGLKAARTLLSDTAEPLRVIEALLGGADPLTRSCRDEAAITANRCAVGYFNKRRRGTGVARVLQRARAVAVSESTIELIDQNLAVVATEPLLREVEPLLDSGQIDAAAARLRAWHRLTTDPDREAALEQILVDPRRLASKPHNNNPGCVFFLGAHQYGMRDSRAEPGTAVNTHVTTLYLTFLWIPLVPLTANIVGHDTATGERIIGGRVPLSEAARRYRVFALVALPVLFAAWTAGAFAALYTAALGASIAAVCLVLRQEYLRAWAKKREESA
ncbi:hypothetical protein [Glycomyces buryatensis]|uniref:Uncharacterized protein n=1 Tax=Glycomyces buryatensis TaxID=2570927 RepID=A0A4S8QG64_9ACTN|nr:hypothetical protein [Glycomyces buryatensis]THV43418.1 hypothetical protein FAB82_01720 [Glycomyces buryatensis]